MFYKKTLLFLGIKMLKKIVFSILFIFLFMLSFFYISKSYEAHKSEIVHTQITELNNLYQGAVTTFRLNAKAVFYNIIMQPEVLNILRQLPDADKNKTATLHNKLYKLLEKRYLNLKNSLYVRQLHFHHTDGRSFLRMHRPEKYGDPLFDVRYSVKVSNTKKIYIEGFEEGRIFNGYRYVYPILDNNTHLGSVEISVSMNAIINQLSQIFTQKSFYFMIDKNIMSKKVFDSEMLNYEISTINDDYVVDKEVFKTFDKKYEKYLDLLNNEEIKTEMKNNTIKVKSIKLDDISVIATFLPIWNIEKNSLSYLISFENNKHFYTARKEFIYQLLFSLVSIILILGSIYFLIERSQRISRSKEKLDQLVTERTAELKHVLDEKIKSYQEIILAMVNLTEERDTYTAGHTKRVAQYSKLIAEEMKYSDNDIKKLYEAAILHDIGKIITPDNVLLKPGKLNFNEFEIIKEHVKTGEHILNNIGLYKDLTEIVSCHHERYDGSGYPNGLKGDEIPPLARILAVADTFDAMTTNRIYKPRKSLDIALKELKSLSGIHYDKSVISAALKVFKEIEIDVTVSQLPTNSTEEARLSHFFKDPLTGLYNINYLDLILQHGIESQQYECANIISLKEFTLINNKYGWENGNEILKKLANFLMEEFTSSMIFRIFGDDFIILNKKHLEIDAKSIKSKIDKICQYTIILSFEHYDIRNKNQRNSLIKELNNTIG